MTTYLKKKDGILGNHTEVFFKNLFSSSSTDLCYSGGINEKYLLEFIINRLTSRKFRPSSLSEKTKETLVNIISEKISKKEPIHFILPFGGYKKRELEAAPIADWAELFNLAFMKDYLNPIANIYSPGVILEYFSADVLIGEIAAYSKRELDLYLSSFRKIIDNFQKNLPANFVIKITSSKEIAPPNYFKEILPPCLRKIRKEWQLSENKEKVEYAKVRAARNLIALSKKLSKNEYEKLVEEKAQLHEAYLLGQKKWGYIFEGGKIPISLRNGIPRYLHLKSTRSSTAQFWIAQGYLIFHKNKLTPYIATLNQVGKIKLIRSFEINLDELFGENFAKINIIENPHLSSHKIMSS